VQPEQPEVRVEVHLLDFNSDLYGQELEIIFVEKLRDETRFPSLDALKQQIALDIAHARTLF
jgi:riboflavin kinase/FMN adenylyltransferase